jgi:hypothetical protein
MTDELQESLRRELLESEPAWSVQAQAAMASGKRYRRARRRLKMGSGALGVALVAGLSVYVASLPGGETNGVDPATATASAIENYDPQAMPTLLESKARDALSGEVANLGAGTFVAADPDTYAQLESADYARAIYMYVDFGDPKTRTWRLFVSREGSATDSLSADFCKGGLESGWMLSCSVTTDGDDQIVSYTDIGTLVPNAGGYEMADWRKLDGSNLDDVRLGRQVDVIHSSGYATTVREQVFGPTSLDPDKAFEVSTQTMEKLARDPSIYLAPPSK